MSLSKTSYQVPYRECMVQTGGSALDASSDFSVTGSEFEVSDSGVAGQDITINKLIFTIVCSSAASNSGQFGNIAGLTTGISVKYDVNSTNVYTLGNYKSLIALDLESDEHYVVTVGTDVIYEYEMKFEDPFVLKGGHGDRLYVTVDDNFSSLTGLYFSVAGSTSTAKFNI